MTPKQKAEQLVDKYFNEIMSFLSDNMKKNNAKKCALIAVDEIIEVLSMDVNPLVNYWFQVKQEIEKL